MKGFGMLYRSAVSSIDATTGGKSVSACDTGRYDLGTYDSLRRTR